MIIRASLALFLAAATFASAPADARQHRSREVTREFERENPCPSTGRHYGACPGYIKDHGVALCDGGADAVSNMEWQTVAAAKAKDRTECKSEFARSNRHMRETTQ